MNTVFIYALCEPGTRTVRYIGKTCDLTRRLREHVISSVKDNSLLGEWLRGLSRPPEMLVLCETSEAFWQDDETYHIRAARASGDSLVNSTDGGEGCSGWSATPETRARFSAAKLGNKNPNFGKKALPETRAKLSAARSGEKNHNFGKKATPEKLAKMSFAATGKIPSSSTRAKLSAAGRGRKDSLETRAKKSIAKMGRLNPNFGKKDSLETRAKKSVARMGEKNPNFGKKKLTTKPA